MNTTYHAARQDLERFADRNGNLATQAEVQVHDGEGWVSEDRGNSVRWLAGSADELATFYGRIRIVAVPSGEVLFPHHAVPVKRTMDGRGTCKSCGDPTYSDRGIYRHVDAEENGGVPSTHHA